MKNKAVIVSGGMVELEVLKAETDAESYIIGVDRGIDFLDRYKIPMDYLVGDFDSVQPEIIEKYKKENLVPIREFNPVKDASDTEIAVRLAMELGYKNIVILGATGSRIDHIWANIQVLTIPYEVGVDAKIIDRYNCIRLLDKETVLRKEKAYGTYFSVFSLGGAVEGLTIKGAKYVLDNHKLLPYDSLSVSNQIEDDMVEINYKTGHLLLMESKEQ